MEHTASLQAPGDKDAEWFSVSIPEWNRLDVADDPLAPARKVPCWQLLTVTPQPDMSIGADRRIPSRARARWRRKSLRGCNGRRSSTWARLVALDLVIDATIIVR